MTEMVTNFVKLLLLAEEVLAMALLPLLAFLMLLTGLSWVLSSVTQIMLVAFISVKTIGLSIRIVEDVQFVLKKIQEERRPQ